MIINFGSINVDHVYRVATMPLPGETLSVQQYRQFLGGKGINQSIAAQRAGARVLHVGAVGGDGDWAISQIEQAGLSTKGIEQLDGHTGHAVITVDDNGENQILIVPGANRELHLDALQDAMRICDEPGWLLLQNETNQVEQAATLAQSKGWQVAYSAAPFVVADATPVLSLTDLLLVNEVERSTLESSLDVATIPCPMVLTTLGSRGAVFDRGDDQIKQAAYDVNAIDTTGAGDTFAGSFVARLDCGDAPSAAMQYAAAASAIQVTREGASTAIPHPDEVKQFMSERISAATVT